jgi:cupin fold WbuC family metalloprotein
MKTISVTHQDKLLAYIIPAQDLPDKTTFLTDEDAPQQLGYIVYPKGGECPRHRHLPVARNLTGTTETLIVMKGRCLVDFYDETNTVVQSQQLSQGDIVQLRDGGHGFRFLENTVLLEVKQGPYPGVAEKERF